MGARPRVHSVYAPSRDISRSCGVSHENLRVIAKGALDSDVANERREERKRVEERDVKTTRPLSL